MFSNLIKPMNFGLWKIARKSRSKVMWTSSSCSGDWKPNLDTTVKVSPVSVSGEATSCLSNNSSGITSARSLRYANRSRCTSVMENEMERVTPPPAKQRRSKNYVGTPHLRRRGEAILKFLALGGSSELRIREMLGDSPDTSKALRMWFSLSLSLSLTDTHTHATDYFTKIRRKLWLYTYYVYEPVVQIHGCTRFALLF